VTETEGFDTRFSAVFVATPAAIAAALPGWRERTPLERLGWQAEAPLPVSLPFAHVRLARKDADAWEERWLALDLTLADDARRVPWSTEHDEVDHEKVFELVHDRGLVREPLTRGGDDHGTKLHSVPSRLRIALAAAKPRLDEILRVTNEKLEGAITREHLAALVELAERAVANGAELYVWLGVRG